MTTHNVEIRVEGTRGKVLIDGHDIARGVVGLTFEAGIDGPPRLRLELNLINVTTIDSTQAEVLLGDGVADALTALGWAAPRDDG